MFDTEKMAVCFRGHLGVVVVAALLLASTEKTGAVRELVGDDWDLDNVPGWGVDSASRPGEGVLFAQIEASEIEVLQSKEEFESCDLHNPIKMYKDGLHGDGTRYFASGEPEGCKNGLKWPVKVMPTSSNNKATAAAVALDQAMPPAASSSNSIHHLSSMLWILIIAFAISLGLQL